MNISFADNRLVAALYGSENRNLTLIEKRLGVLISQRGNEVRIEGLPSSKDQAKRTLRQLYEKLQSGIEMNDELIEDCLVRVALPQNLFGESELCFTTPKRKIMPRTLNQAHYMQALQDKELTFGIGPAGSGKTWLAVAAAVEALVQNRVERIILTRPAVEAGEHLGFLPGAMKEKIDPYLRPIYDSLNDMLRQEDVVRKIEVGDIEIAPLAFMRGRGLKNAFIILDEAQNTTPMQMKMFLTRLGMGSRMVINGDLSQIDLPRGQASGLAEASSILGNIKEIAICQLTAADIVRHPLVAKIVGAYEKLATSQSSIEIKHKHKNNG